MCWKKLVEQVFGETLFLYKGVNCKIDFAKLVKKTGKSGEINRICFEINILKIMSFAKFSEKRPGRKGKDGLADGRPVGAFFP